MYILQLSELEADSTLSNKKHLDRFNDITRVVDSALGEVALVNE